MLLKWYTVILGIVFIVCMVLQTGIRRIPGIPLDDHIRTDVYLTDGSVLHYDTNSFEPVKRGSRLVFYVDVPQEAKDISNPTLGLSVYNSLVTVRYGDQVIYQQVQKYPGPGGHTVPRISVPQGLEEPLTIELLQQADNVTSHFTGVVILPGQYAWLYPILNGSSGILAFFMTAFAVISLISVILYGILSIQKRSLLKGASLSLFCLCTAMWAMGFTGSLFLFTNDEVMAPYVEYIALFLITVFFCSYMGIDAPAKRKRMCTVMGTFAVVVFLAATLIQFFSPEHDGYIILLVACHGELMAGLLYFTWIMFSDKTITDKRLRNGMVITMILAMLETVRVILTRAGNAENPLLYRFTTFQLTPYVVFALGLTLSIDYAMQGYETFREQMKVEQFKEAAYLDSLTGLGSRAAFEDQETLILENAGTYAVAFIDVDGLKHVNDTMGHDAGDHLLETAAYAIRSGCASSGSRAYRYGGDEFLIVDTKEDRVRKAVEVMRQELTQADGTSVSAGVSFGGKETETLADVIQKADALMYQEKMKKHKTRDELEMTDRMKLYEQ